MKCFVYTAEDDRLPEVAEHFRSFTSTFASNAGIPPRQVALVSWSGEQLDAIGTVTRLRKVATYQVGLRFRHLTFLDSPVDTEALLDALAPRHGNRVAVVAGSQGQLPKDTAEAVGEA